VAAAALVLDGGNAQVVSAVQAGARAFTIPAASNDTFCLLAATQTLTAKTIVDAASNVAARSLQSSSGVVTVNGNTPSTGQLLVATGATTATWQTVATPVFYRGTSVVTAPVAWSGTVASSSGTATVTVTSDGTTGGTPLCASLTTSVISATALFNTATANNVVLVGIKSVSSTQIVLNLVQGTGVLVGGNTIQANTASCTVHVQVMC
jgi:hypothetical protein